VGSLPEHFDIIFHLATINGTQNFYEIPFDVAASCAIPTWNLINKYKTSGIEKFILAGTPESYATSVELGIAGIPTPEDVPLSISSPQEPRWSYAAGKIFAEALLCGAAKQFNFPFAIARFHNVYGPRMGPHHLIPDFLKRAVAGDYSVYGSQNTRSFLYVDDAISDLIKISELSNERELILNIGSSEEIKVANLARIILKTLSINSDLEVFDAPSHSVSRRIPDLTKIDTILGERSRIKLQEGLSRCIVEYFPEFEGEI
jgi:nucleoside-diphosphate-sugar epimerase